MAKPGLMIALGLRPKPSEDAPPTPFGKPAPPDAGEPDADDTGGGKVGPEDVGYSDQDLCETCANMGSDGNCTKYNFPVDKTGHCEGGYEPGGGAGTGSVEEGMSAAS